MKLHLIINKTGGKGYLNKEDNSISSCIAELGVNLSFDFWRDVHESYSLRNFLVDSKRMSYDEVEKKIIKKCGYVYFFMNQIGNIKIGKSKNYKGIFKRLNTCRTADPSIILISVLPIPVGKEGKQENLLHKKFNEHRIWKRREWFRPAKEILNLIEQL